MDLQTMHEELRVLTDRAEITDLVDRLLLSLDERKLDESWARSTFTEDIRSETPLGDHEGLQAMVQSTQEALSRFDRTHHVGSNYVIDLGGEHATVRWNAIMTHMHPASRPTEQGQQAAASFTVDGYFESEVIRTADGWRFRRMTVHPVWTTGEPPLRTSPQNR